MFDSVKRYFRMRALRKRMHKIPQLKRIEPRKLNYGIEKKWTPKRILINAGLICAWIIAIIKAPESVLVGALSVTLLSSMVRKLFNMQSGLTSDLMHSVLDIGAFAIATGAWMYAREFIILSTAIGIPIVTSDIETRYNSY